MLLRQAELLRRFRSFREKKLPVGLEVIEWDSLSGSFKVDLFVEVDVDIRSSGGSNGTPES